MVWGQKIKVVQNDLKHTMVLEFLKSNEIKYFLNLDEFLFW